MADGPSSKAGARARDGDAGRKVRAEVLGDEYSRGAVDAAGVSDFEDLALRFAWGEVWSRPGLDRRMRSALTITALVALGKPVELELHVRAGLRNGLTPEEISEILIHCAVYCGMPAANAAFRVAEPILSAARAPR